MANTVTKQCLVCGSKYQSCIFCDSQNDFLAWRSVVCKPEHMAYHIPIIAYVRKIISKNEARQQLLEAEKEYGKIEYAKNIKDVVSEIKTTSKGEKKKTVAQSTNIKKSSDSNIVET